MRFDQQDIDTVSAAIAHVRPEWTTQVVYNTARRMPDDVEWPEFATRLMRAALDAHTERPGRLVNEWDQFGEFWPSNVSRPAPATDKRFQPGTRIRVDDEYASDRDPVTGRTDPVKQRARILALVGKTLPTAPPPPGCAHWGEAETLMRSDVVADVKAAIAAYADATEGAPRTWELLACGDYVFRAWAQMRRERGLDANDEWVALKGRLAARNRASAPRR